MRGVLTGVLLVAGVVAGGGVIEAQGLLARPGPQHASVSAVASAPAAAPGSGVTLWADVTPNRSIHIYAEGASAFTPVSLVLTPNPSVVAGKPKYPRPQVASTPGAVETVPAYTQKFRIVVPVTIKPSAKAGDALTIGGVIHYQACDDRLCYPVTSAPVVWNVLVK
ncbi:MAG TPA: protein-disulfide reductase DsbD domain-containing protein [Vicinamibacterales bacterium]|nr:protein-disulfide reductase DsbD domain-containing protein [Vicinamibacterales bacterium]